MSARERIRNIQFLTMIDCHKTKYQIALF